MSVDEVKSVYTDISATVAKTNKKNAENKTTVNKEYDKKGIGLALAGLAVLGAAAVGVAHALKTRKANDLKTVANEACSVLNDAVAENQLPKEVQLINKNLRVLNLKDRYASIMQKKGVSQNTMEQAINHCQRLSKQSSDILENVNLLQYGMAPIENKKIIGCLYNIVTTECRDEAGNVTPKMNGLMKEVTKYTGKEISNPENLVIFVKKYVNKNIGNFIQCFEDKEKAAEFVRAFI